MTHSIQVEDISKVYRITQGGAGYQTLRETLVGLATGPFSRKRAAPVEDFWALQGINLTVDPGEVVGLVGRNGSGKSTLLKVLCRVTNPTRGRVVLNGRVGSLLEVGTGFHPELSGRENIFLNGAILGMSRAEIAAKFEEIVEFAEISKFLDTPVKRYSSGMYVRLAFAVAAHLEPEILLVDEVLAVGDAAFQRKCLGKMGEVARQGRTIVFVSHNMAALTRLCERVFWLEGGKLKESGPAEAVVSRYLASGAERSGEVTFGGDNRAPGSEYVRLRGVRLRNMDGEVSSMVEARSPFHLEVEYEVLQASSSLRIAIRLMAQDGTALLVTSDLDDREERKREPGVYVSTCTIPGEFLNYGDYTLNVGCDFPGQRQHFFLEHVLGFHVAPVGGVGAHLGARPGLLRMQLPWDVSKVELKEPALKS